MVNVWASPEEVDVSAYGLGFRVYYHILGLYRDIGKENGNYYNMLGLCRLKFRIQGLEAWGVLGQCRSSSEHVSGCQFRRLFFGLPLKYDVRSTPKNGSGYPWESIQIRQQSCLEMPKTVFNRMSLPL